MQNGTFGMDTDDRSASEETPVFVPRPRTFSDDTGTAYRALFDAAASSPVVETPTPKRPKRSRRKTRLLVVAGLVVLALLAAAVAGGLAWAAHVRKQPALDALREGNTVFEPVAAGLRRATDLAGLRTAAEGAGATADRIDEAAEAVSSPSTALERAVRDVLREESALLRAADGLSTLDIETLGTWPALRDTMGDAEAALATDVDRLAGIEASAARQVRTGHGVATHSDELVADFASTSIVDLLGTQLEAMVAATTTADLRTVAGATQESSSIVALALEGVDPEGDQGVRITRVGEALSAITGLSALTGERLGVWSAVRTRLVTTTTGVEGVDSRNAVIAVDALVARAAQQLKAWKTASAAAAARNQGDLKALETYATAVTTALTAQGKADQAAAAFLAKVKADPESVTNAQAVAYLDSAAQARAAVTTALQAAAPGQPLKALQPSHEALVTAATTAAEVVKSGREGTKKTSCGTVPPTTPEGKPTPAPCYYASTPGYAALSSGFTSQVEDFTPVRTAWDEALADLRTAITKRALPAKPVV